MFVLKLHKTRDGVERLSEFDGRRCLWVVKEEEMAEYVENGVIHAYVTLNNV